MTISKCRYQHKFWLWHIWFVPWGSTDITWLGRSCAWIAIRTIDPPVISTFLGKLISNTCPTNSSSNLSLKISALFINIRVWPVGPPKIKEKNPKIGPQQNQEINQPTRCLFFLLGGMIALIFSKLRNLQAWEVQVRSRTLDGSLVGSWRQPACQVGGGSDSSHLGWKGGVEG